jgi:proliferating cell nuclear antigen
MLEAKLVQGNTFKKVIDALKDLVQEANFDCSPAGITLQSMDQAHVTLVMLLMRADGFDEYRCDRSLPLGINMTSLAKVIKAAGPDDAITLKAGDNGETLGLVFEAPRGERVSEYDLKLMDLDTQQLGVPHTDYDVQVKMSAGELQRICRDLIAIDDTVRISAAKDSVRFKAKGDLGTGSVILTQATSMSVDSKDKETEPATTILLRNACDIDLSLKFLSAFTKATPLSDTVNIGFSEGIPCLVEYPVQKMGYLRFYLAPKVDD